MNSFNIIILKVETTTFNSFYYMFSLICGGYHSCNNFLYQKILYGMFLRQVTSY